MPARCIHYDQISRRLLSDLEEYAVVQLLPNLYIIHSHDKPQIQHLVCTRTNTCSCDDSVYQKVESDSSTFFDKACKHLRMLHFHQNTLPKETAILPLPTKLKPVSISTLDSIRKFYDNPLPGPTRRRHNKLVPSPTTDDSTGAITSTGCIAEA